MTLHEYVYLMIDVTAALTLTLVVLIAGLLIIACVFHSIKIVYHKLPFRITIRKKK